MAAKRSPTAEEIAVLQAVVAAAVTEALAPVAARIADLEASLAKARTAFAELRATQRLVPRTEPASVRIPRSDFDRALEDLRADAAEEGSPRRIWPRDAILARAHRLAQLEAQTRAADETAE